MPPAPSRTIAVDFEHWRVVLRDEWLRRYGSPHFEPSRARYELMNKAIPYARQVEPRQHLTFDRAQIVLANEVFPEAAMADPLADLEVWNEWSSGIRAFPYPGRFSRLGLVAQEGKTTATSSVGVLGEIVAGLFAQTAISPKVLVRVVRRWPDFIFYTDDERYSFVEAKAFTMKQEPHAKDVIPTGLDERVQASLLGECAHQAVQQLNADPSIKVWGAFTAIRRISPFALSVTFVEFDCEHHRRTATTPREPPQAVITGLAQRALSMAAAELAPYQLQRLQTTRRTDNRVDVERKLVDHAQRFVPDLLAQAGPKDVVMESRPHVEAEIEHLVRSATVPELDEGKQFFTARALAAQGQTAPVRIVGDSLIQVVDLPREVIERLDQSWSPGRWSDASKPYEPMGPRAWRFGGAVYMVEDGASTADHP